MTLAQWLSERLEDAPPRLVNRINEALGDRLHAETGDVSALCVDAAEALLRDLLSRDSAGRDVALDLLTADALATYAFEAASSEPSTLESRAADAATRFAATAA